MRMQEREGGRGRLSRMLQAPRTALSTLYLCQLYLRYKGESVYKRNALSAGGNNSILHRSVYLSISWRLPRLHPNKQVDSNV